MFHSSFELQTAKNCPFENCTFIYKRGFAPILNMLLLLLQFPEKCRPPRFISVPRRYLEMDFTAFKGVKKYISVAPSTFTHFEPPFLAEPLSRWQSHFSKSIFGMIYNLKLLILCIDSRFPLISFLGRLNFVSPLRHSHSCLAFPMSQLKCITFHSHASYTWKWHFQSNFHTWQIFPSGNIRAIP